MNNEQALKIVEFLAKYNEHFDETVDFLLIKQQKVLCDDLLWLHDSINDEQRLCMAGSSIEARRLKLFEEMGYSEYSSADIYEILPEEYKGRFKMECVNMENSILKIKALNKDISEAVEKKLIVADTYLKGQEGKSGFYSASGSRLRLGNPEDEIIGEM